MKVLIALIYLFVANQVYAAKWIDLEWEKVEGATGYELEVTRVQGDDEFPLGIFKSKKPKYKKKVIPGQYQIRIRTIDNRGVPGDWTEAIDAVVDITEITRYRPLKKEEIANTKGTKTVKVSFVWEKIEGLKEYQLTVSEIDGDTVFSEVVKGVNKNLQLNPAKNYQWTIAAVIQGKIGEASKPWPFTVLGKALSAPTARVAKEEKTIIFNFSHEKDTVNYHFQLFRSKKGKLKKIIDKKNLEKNSFKLKRSKFKKGEYKLELKAKEKGSLDSYPRIVEFYYDGYTIRYLGSDREKARELRKWHLRLAAGYGPGSGYRAESGLFSSGSNIRISMPTIRMMGSIGYRSNGEWGFHFANESYTSSDDSFFYREFRFYYHSKPWRLGKFGVSGGLGIYNIRSFVIIPQSFADKSLNTRHVMPLDIGGIDFRVDFYYFAEGNWTYWVEFTKAIGPEVEDNLIYDLEQTKESHNINTISFNAGYKFTEKLDLSLSLSWHTQEFYFENPRDTGSGNGPGPRDDRSRFSLNGYVGQVNFDFYY